MTRLARLLGGAALACAASLPAAAQGQYAQSSYYAYDYGKWALQSQAANTFVFYPNNYCQVTTPSGTFVPFKVGTQVFIRDQQGANSEVLTPTVVRNDSTGCGISVAPTKNHGRFQVISATGGLQESLNSLALANNSLPATIFLDRNWYAAITSVQTVTGKTPAQVIAAAAGNAKAFLVDQTTAPWTYYTWSGTAYTKVLYSAN